jgi:hypothetical protein
MNDERNPRLCCRFIVHHSSFIVAFRILHTERMMLGTLPVHFASEDDADALLAQESSRVREITPEATKTSLLSAIAEALALPDYFGQNWDALEESLRDLELDGEMLVLIVRDAGFLWEEMPREMSMLVEIWLAAAGKSNIQMVFVW